MPLFVSMIVLKIHTQLLISSAESQKGVNAFQQRSVEKQKGAIAIDFVQWWRPSGFQQNIIKQR